VRKIGKILILKEREIQDADTNGSSAKRNQAARKTEISGTDQS
jgi:hypothetical protein